MLGIHGKCHATEVYIQAAQSSQSIVTIHAMKSCLELKANKCVHFSEYLLLSPSEANIVVSYHTRDSI